MALVPDPEKSSKVGFDFEELAAASQGRRSWLLAFGAGRRLRGPTQRFPPPRVHGIDR